MNRNEWYLRKDTIVSELKAVILRGVPLTKAVKEVGMTYDDFSRYLPHSVRTEIKSLSGRKFMLRPGILPTTTVEDFNTEKHNEQARMVWGRHKEEITRKTEEQILDGAIITIPPSEESYIGNNKNPFIADEIGVWPKSDDEPRVRVKDGARMANGDIYKRPEPTTGIKVTGGQKIEVTESRAKKVIDQFTETGMLTISLPSDKELIMRKQQIRFALLAVVQQCMEPEPGIFDQTMKEKLNELVSRGLISREQRGKFEFCLSGIKLTLSTIL